MPNVSMPNGDVVAFPDDMPSEQIKGMIASKFPDAASGMGNSQQSTQPNKISPGMDFLKSIGGGLERGAAAMPMIIPNLLNQAAAGPQLLGIGLKDTLMGNPTTKNPKLWQPFYSSEDVLQSLPEALKPHNPQTTAGVGADLAGQLIGGIGAGKAIQSVAPSVENMLSNESSGRPAVVKNSSLPDELKPLESLQNSSQNTTFARNPNTIKTGLEANQKISAQYGKDTELLRQSYGKLNQAGQFSMPADEVYTKGNSLIESLQKQIAPDSYERTALGNLQDIIENLQSKNAVAPKYDALGITKIDQPAYIIQPSDAVDIKTTLNQLAKSGKFTNSGQARILEFKSYIQNFLNDASKVSPEFGNSLNAAESQAARVGQYKSPALRTLWQPEDYISWKAGNEPGASTLGRASTFLKNLNNENIGRAASIGKILPPEDAESLFRAAILNGRGSGPNLPKAGIELVTGHPLAAARTMVSSFTSPNKTPLLDAANQLKALNAPKAVSPKPAIERPQAALMAPASTALLESESQLRPQKLLPAPMINQQEQNQQPTPQPQSNAISQTPDLFSRVIQSESRGNQAAISPKGAIGVAQIMPRTAPDAARAAGLPYDFQRLQTDPQYNAALGKAYLDKMIQRYGDESTALVAYNWGPANADRWVKNGSNPALLPKETREYVLKILGG